MNSATRLATTREDPVLAAIERMRAAEARLNDADEAIEFAHARPMGISGAEPRLATRGWSREQHATREVPGQFASEARDRELREALQLYRTAWKELLETRPTSLLGFSAKVFYLTEYEEDEISRTLHNDVISLLRESAS